MARPDTPATVISARPGQELASVDVSVAVLVVEIVDALVDLQLGHRCSRLPCSGAGLARVTGW